MQFVSMEEAEKHMLKSTKEMTSKLCPILREKCSPECITFNGGNIETVDVESSDIKIYVVTHGPFCSNAMIVGEGE